MRVLVISAHPDDETIGAGGTIARHVSQGDDVYWCVVTQAYQPEWSEKFIEAAKLQIINVKNIYGIKKVYSLGFPTVKLNTVPYIELSSAIQSVVDNVCPEIVYTTPAEDLNQDHRIVHDCTLVAARPLSNNNVRRLLSYEISTTSSFGIPGGVTNFYPNVVIDISKYIEKKIEAMKCYLTEIKNYPHPRSIKGIRLLSKERGLSFGVEAAECFKLIREIIYN
jgi:LmbE family N-acetylglucosaminyl deacetylase